MSYSERWAVGTQTTNWLFPPIFQPNSKPVNSWLDFTPADLTDVAFWFDASNEASFTYSSGTSVSQWNSMVRSVSLVQATATKQPSRSGVVNGRSAVVFDGSSDSMSTSTTLNLAGAYNSGQAISLWWVGSAASGGDQCFFEHTSNFNSFVGAFNIYRLASNKPEFARFAPYNTFASSVDLTTTPRVVIVSYNGLAPGADEVRMWNNLNTGGTKALSGNIQASMLDSTIFVGARNNASFFLNGSVCEFGLTRTALTENEAQALHYYLQSKWGISW